MEKTFDFVESVLTLFKAVPNLSDEKFSAYTLDNERNILNGFFITEEAFKVCPCIGGKKFFQFLKYKFGYDIFELNQSFYKSFQTVAKSSPQKILANKILHYMTTYGFENLGIFERDMVYIPNEKLELPEDAKPVKITVINFLDKKEIEERTINLIMSGAALSGETLKNILVIIRFLEINLNVDDVPNKELKNYLCDMLGLVPKNPVEFLRYMLYKGINSTLLIKDQETIFALKNSEKNFDRYFSRYIEENGLKKLAEIFHRFKPLWLAFKIHSPYLRTTINKMRKLADKYHKPSEKKILDCVTSSEKIDFEKLKTELSKVTVFKKISIANSILFRSAAPENIAYYIRNGKVFVDDYTGNFKLNYKILSAVIDSIVEEIRPNVQGKKIFIPENFNYALPVSEKKIIGAIPYGSHYTFEKNSVVIGVHWFNLSNEEYEERVDLDLHLNSPKRDIGWQNDFSRENFIDTKNCLVIFSGDMTDAPIKKGGATEAFFVGEKITDETMMVNLNNYTKNKNSVPFKIFLGGVEQDKIDRKYLIDSHEISFCIPNEISAHEMFLGFLISDENGGKKFYFTSGTMGNRIVARSDKNSDKMISALKTSFESCMSLKEILEKAGAVFEKSDEEEWDINLNPAEVTKDILLGMFQK
ncbi:MAG: hypothetical protein IK062_11800 [Selenomonadaceae bacterium]|nr:hypothetical protein [Selenomonadaceae bacterium]